MGNRLSKIYTRTGDDGSTGLGNGDRVRKDDLRVEAYGTVDELNSLIGLVRATGLGARMDEQFETIQQKLFDLGGELCIPGHTVLQAEDARVLESWLDDLNEDLPALKDFILPGGSPAAAHCHLARAVARRAERRLVSMAESTEINIHALHFLNRLSDFLFVAARALNHSGGHPETLWNGGRKPEE